MTSEARSRSERFVDELSDLDQRSADAPDNVSLLQGMRDGLERLIDANDGNVGAIRALLQSSCDRGELRRETLELVSSMLDHYTTEDLPTSDSQPSGDDSDRAEQDDEFASTMVLSETALKVDAPDRRLQVGSVLRDRFLLQKQVAGGSMGVVYKALDRRLAETGEEQPFVAIKVISPILARDAKALRALQQEAAKGRCLTHNHIVRFFDLDRDDDLYFIVMEWLEGENLADMLDRGETINAERSWQITRQIGQALDYAHRCGIVHADIKPANVMIMPNGDAKLFDFGVARARQSAERSDFSPSELGAITPAYSSMQVLTGEEPVAEDDVFSLACLYYRLVAGYRVFGPRNAAEAAEEGMSPQPLQGIQEKQWKAARKALSFARVTRYPTVGEFLADLAPDEKADAITADRRSRIELEPDLPGSSKMPWVALFAVILLGVAAAYYAGFLDRYLVETDNRDADGQDQSMPVEPRADSEAPVTGPPPTGQTASETSGRPESTGDTRIDTNVAAERVVAEEPDPAADPRNEVVNGANFDAAGGSASDRPRSPASEMLQGDARLLLQPDGRIAITLREADEPVVLDVIRTANLARQEIVSLRVVDYSANRSPLDTGDLEMSPASELVFAAGAARAQITLATRDDPVREADQTATLLLRTESGVESAAEIQLHDDDQRRFEASLPANTVAFAAGQVSVEERDAAVQLDVVRFKPDAQALSVRFLVSDVTATADEDYFPPSDTTISFAPGQRTARILVPLVQDTEIEGNEAFVLELINDNQVSDAEIYQRIAVMIRDDD